MKNSCILITVAVCSIVFLTTKILGISYSEEKQLSIYEFSTLDGIEVICPKVFMHAGSENNKVMALTENDLRILVELELRKAGVTLISETLLKKSIHEGNPPPNCGELEVFVEVSSIEVFKDDANTEPDVYAIKVSTEFLQFVKLVRNQEIVTMARTWPLRSWVVGRGLILTGKNKAEKGIKDAVARQIGEFLNDYLNSNPINPSKTNN